MLALLGPQDSQDHKIGSHEQDHDYSQSWLAAVPSVLHRWRFWTLTMATSQDFRRVLSMSKVLPSEVREGKCRTSVEQVLAAHRRVVSTWPPVTQGSALKLQEVGATFTAMRSYLSSYPWRWQHGRALKQLALKQWHSRICARP